MMLTAYVLSMCATSDAFCRSELLSTVFDKPPDSIHGIRTDVDIKNTLILSGTLKELCAQACNSYNIAFAFQSCISLRH